MISKYKVFPDIKLGTILYIVLTILFLTLGAITQQINVYFGIVVTEVLILGAISVLWARLKKNDISMTFGLNKPKRGTMLRSVVIMIVLYPIVAMINAFFLTIITNFLPMPENLSGVPIPESIGMLLISIITFAILPGIFEELVFRGYLFRAFSKFKVSSRIMITALLFALFHYNPYNFIGPFILGIVLGFIRYRSNSIFPSMIAHATNNSIAMILGYLIKDLPDTEITNDVDLVANMDVSVIQVVFVISILGLLVIAGYKLLKNYPKYNEKVSIFDKLTRTDKVFTLLSVVCGIVVLSGMIAVLLKMV